VRSCYVRQPDLEDLWRERRDRPGGERKLVRKYGAFGLLVIDEWLLDRPDTEFRSMLLELMELRYGTASTVFCTQFKKKDWHPRDRVVQVFPSTGSLVRLAGAVMCEQDEIWQESRYFSEVRMNELYDDGRTRGIDGPVEWARLEAEARKMLESGLELADRVEAA